MNEEKNYKPYVAVDYFDVWGNREDGWEVNNLSRGEEDIYISTDATEKDIKKLARSVFGILPRKHINVIWNDEYMIEIEHVSGYPIGRFELDQYA